MASNGGSKSDTDTNGTEESTMTDIEQMLERALGPAEAHEVLLEARRGDDG